MSKKTAMQRTLAELKKQDVIYQIVEYYHYYAKRRFDLFGIIDILVLDIPETIGIQVCLSDYQEHIKKIKASATILPWLQCGNQFEIWSWRKYLKKRGCKAKEWRVKVTDVLQVHGEIYFEENK